MLSIFSNLFSFLGRNLGYWCFYLLKFRFLKCFVTKSVFWSRCRSEPSFYRWSRSRIFLPRARAEKKISGDRAGAEEKWLSSATLVVHIVLLLYFYFLKLFLRLMTQYWGAVYSITGGNVASREYWMIDCFTVNFLVFRFLIDFY